jgi:hypothetical protein
MTKEDLIKAGAGALLTTVVTVAFAYARTFFEVKWIIFSIFAITANFAIYAGLTAFYRSESKHQDSLEVLKSVQERMLNLELAITNRLKFKWILSVEQLQALEKAKKKSHEIWILTEDPSDDTGNSSWVPVIQDNLKNDIKYIYLCLRNSGVRGAINDLKDVFRDYPNSCDVVILDTDEFERFPYRHIVIYDPYNLGGEVDCYAEINAPEKGCWLQLPKAERHSVIGRATDLVAKAKNINLF